MPSKRLWLGHAPDVPQIDQVEFGPTAVLAEGTDLVFEINEKQLPVENPHPVVDENDPQAGDSGALLTLLQRAEAAINSSTIPEFAEVVAEVESPDTDPAAPYHRLFVSSRTPGNPFNLTVTAPHPTIDVDVVQAGGPGVNEKQSIVFLNTPTGGDWTIEWDLGSGVETSADIPFEFDADDVKDAIVNGMSSVGPAEILVTGTGTEADPLILELTGALAQTDVDELTVDASNLTGGGIVTIGTQQDGSSGTSSNQVDNLFFGTSPAGTCKIRVTIGGVTHDTTTLTVSNNAADIQDALRVLPHVGSNVDVYGGSRAGISKGYVVHWRGALSGQQVTVTLINDTNCAVTNLMKAGLPGWPETYVLETHAASGGTFTLSQGGNTTSAIAYNAPTESGTGSVDFKLEALSSVGFGGVKVPTVVIPTDCMVCLIQFVAHNNFTNVSDLTANFSGISGTANLTKLFDGGRVGDGSQFANDNFTDTNGTALTSHTSDSSHTWTDGKTQGNDFEIQSNKARYAISSGSPGDWDVAHLSENTHSDLKASAAITITAGTTNDVFGGLTFRYFDGSNFWMAGLISDVAGTGATLVLAEVATGMYSAVAIGSVQHPNGAPHTVNVIANGKGIIVWTALDAIGFYDGAGFLQSEKKHGVAAFGVTDGQVDIDTLSLRELTTGGSNEIQTVWTNGTSGTFTLSKPGGGTTVPLSPTSTTGQIDSALETVYGAGTISSVTGTGMSSDPWVITFGGSLANQNLSQMTGDASELSGLVLTDIDTVQDGTPPIPTIWDVTIHGATGGEFAFSFKGRPTDDIAFGSLASAVQAELEDLAPGDFTGLWTVTGAGTTVSPYHITASGRLAGSPQQLIAHNEDLDGADLAITHTTIQQATGRHWIDDPVNYRDVATGLPGLPETGDELFVQTGDESNSLRYGSLAGRKLKRFVKSSLFSGHIGLPERTDTGYAEYRATHIALEFQAGAQSPDNPNVLIGVEQGQGSGLVRLKTGTDEVHIRVERTGGPVEDTRPSFCWDGQNTDSTLQLIEGFAGVAVFAFTQAQLEKAVQRGGVLRFGEGTAIGAGGFDRTAGETFGRATIGGVPVIFGN